MLLGGIDAPVHIRTGERGSEESRGTFIWRGGAGVRRWEWRQKEGEESGREE